MRAAIAAGVRPSTEVREASPGGEVERVMKIFEIVVLAPEIFSRNLFSKSRTRAISISVGRIWLGIYEAHGGEWKAKEGG
jgi:hypothetical protein